MTKTFDSRGISVGECITFKCQILEKQSIFVAYCGTAVVFKCFLKMALSTWPESVVPLVYMNRPTVTKAFLLWFPVGDDAVPHLR